jgi:hypothetical protein
MRFKNSGTIRVISFTAAVFDNIYPISCKNGSRTLYITHFGLKIYTQNQPTSWQYQATIIIGGITSGLFYLSSEFIHFV